MNDWDYWLKKYALWAALESRRSLEYKRMQLPAYARQGKKHTPCPGLRMGNHTVR